MINGGNYMIWTEKVDEKLFIILSRCNQFDDHKSGNLKGKDGDIVIKCEHISGYDEYDMRILIDEINNRLETLKSSK